MTNDTDLEKARGWLENNPNTWEEDLARFRADAVVEGLRLAAKTCDRIREQQGATYGASAEIAAAAIRALADEREGE